MDLQEFIEEGYVHEANRLFFHPLGLSILWVEEKDGNISLRIVDDRDEPSGVFFQELDQEKMANIWGKWMATVNNRRLLSCCDNQGIQQTDYPKGT